MKKIWSSANAYSWKSHQRAWVYWDGAPYFKAFIEACAQADQEILIAGWDIHSETHLAPDWEKNWVPQRWGLSQFLHRLLKKKPNLHIYLLNWDYSPIYLLEREKLQALRFGWLRHSRLHFRLDAAHPFGASHHQKFVVIDQSLAFLGGMDLTICRWDTCDHLAHNPLRLDPESAPYGPFHDLQIGFNDQVAKPLAKLFCERWQRATGETLILKSSPRNLSPEETPDVYVFDKVSVALSQTFPSFRGAPPCYEIAQLYADCLKAAEHHIILENQYLTSRHIVGLLTAVLKNETGPEVVIILPERAGGWLEQKTMGHLQAQALYCLKQADYFNRLQILYPAHRDLASKDAYITVHSKAMVIDSLIVSIGSANLNNRSMGFDSELNATLALSEPCYRFTAKLLAHHTDGSGEDKACYLLSRGRLKAVVRSLNESAHVGLLQDFPVSLPEKMPFDFYFVDVEKPSVIEEGMDHWAHLIHNFSRLLGMSSPKLILGVGVLLWTLFFGGLYLFIHKFPFDYERLLNFFEVSGSHWLIRHSLIPLAFALGGIFFIPINLMILGTAVLLPFGPALGQILLGIVVNISISYGVGYFGGWFLFRRFMGPRIRQILLRVKKAHFSTMIALRLVPLAPNTLINLAAGVGHVSFVRFLAATLVGMIPGIGLLLLVQKSLFEVLSKPQISSVLILLALLAASLSLAQWSVRRFSHYEHFASGLRPLNHDQILQTQNVK